MAVISNSDLSTLRDTLNTILNGTGVHGGYNQSHSVQANPAAGDLIDDAYQDSLFSAAAKVTNYYNISNPLTAVNAGDIVDDNQYFNHASTLNSDLDTRFNNPWTYSSGWDMTTATETTETVSDWNGSKDTQTRITFNDEATMNAWFSAGGEIRISMSHNDTSNDQQGTSWEQLTTELGTFRISLRDTDTTDVDASIRKKYSELGGSYAEIKKEYADDSDYSANYIAIEAYKDTTTIYVKTVLADAHVARTGSGSGFGGPWSFTGEDQVKQTPKGETVTITAGRSFDVIGKRKVLNFEPLA